MLSDEDLRKLQHALADMLKVFDGFCREHNINYVLAGGTLLGAVRHQGFIPWDDDVDLIMLPEEAIMYFFRNHLSHPRISNRLIEFFPRHLRSS